LIAPVAKGQVSKKLPPILLLRGYSFVKQVTGLQPYLPFDEVNSHSRVDNEAKSDRFFCSGLCQSISQFGFVT
jgi:hypothetical protein